MTSGGSSESSWMEVGAGDGASWDDLVTHAEARPDACKRKKTDAGQHTPGRPFPLALEEARKEVTGIIHEHAVGLEPSQKNIASRAISAYYPGFTLAAVEGVVSQVLCMIAEYHLACATRGSATMSPILLKTVEQYLPLLVDYTCPGGTGITDMRVRDHKSRSLWVAVWLHRVDMSLSWEKEALESLVLSRHMRGHLLSYLLAPGTSNLRFEEVASRVVQENWEMHERVKERFRSSLNSNRRRRAKLLQELDDLSQEIEAAVDRKLHKETEIRMGVLRTTLRKVETSINESEDHLEESRMREEDARQVDWGQSYSNTDEDGDIIVEGAQESGPTGVEDTGPPIPTASTQEAERAMEVDIMTCLSLPPKTPQRSHQRRMTCSQVIPPQWLERWPSYRSPLLKAMSPRMVKPHNRSCPPLCINEVLHMSPLNSPNRRRSKKNEEGRPWNHLLLCHRITMSLYCYS